MFLVLAFMKNSTYANGTFHGFKLGMWIVMDKEDCGNDSTGNGGITKCCKKSFKFLELKKGFWFRIRIGVKESD